MQIPNTLPHFENKKVLFVVMGKQSAKFYKVQGRELQEEDFSIEKFEAEEKKQGSRKDIAADAASEKQKNSTKEFLQEVEQATKKFIQKYHVEQIYVFAPEYIRKQIKELLHKIVPANIEVRSFIGNYTKTHPLDLLKELQGRKERQKDKKLVKVIKEEAIKIMKIK